MTKLIVAFHSFANAPKNRFVYARHDEILIIIIFLFQKSFHISYIILDKGKNGAISRPRYDEYWWNTVTTPSVFNLDISRRCVVKFRPRPLLSVR